MKSPQSPPWYSKGSRVAVYTCLTNNYDRLQEPAVVNPHFDYICFTDNPDIKSKVWQVRPTPGSREILRHIDPSCAPTEATDPLEQQLERLTLQERVWDATDRGIKTARFHKINPHLVLPDYDWTIWIDANMQAVSDFEDLQSIYNVFEMLITQHPLRTCAYTEADTVVAVRKEHKPQRIPTQMERYHTVNFPRDYGLYETGFMVRRNCFPVREVMDEWWSEVAQYSYRDQLSLPFALWAGHTPNMRLVTITNAERHRYVHISPHKLPKTRQPLPEISIRIPYHDEKDLGAAYNREIEMTSPEVQWFLFLDYDFMFQSPFFKRDFQLAILKHPDAGMFTCYASRTANRLQRYDPAADDEYGSLSPNIITHRKIAERVYTQNQSRITCLTTEELTRHKISGFAMCINREAWDQVGGFPETGKALGVDNAFADRLNYAGRKIYRLDGVYGLHYYRLAEGQKNNSHLL